MAERYDTRERILDALEDVLIHDGERSATIERVAERAGVTRGGLTYHFDSKDALIEALIERVRAVGDIASAQMLAAPEGAVEHYIFSAGPPLSAVDKTLLAATRLAHANRPQVAAVLLDIHRQWARVLSHTTGDRVLARLLLLVGDGIYFHSITTGAPFSLGDPAAAESPKEEMEELRALIRRLLASSGRRENHGTLG